MIENLNFIRVQNFSKSTFNKLYYLVRLIWKQVVLFLKLLQKKQQKIHLIINF